MKIEKTKLSKEIEDFIEQEFEKIEKENDLACRYTSFCFCAKENEKIMGVVTGATFFSEVYIDDIIVLEKYRCKGIGSDLIKTVEEYFNNSHFNNINLCTNAFQAPQFYEKLGFNLEFIRENKENPKLTKYFFIKFFIK